ncbi:MAG: hypothetical protein ABIN25_02910, partial [Ginsengibacter sp.]
MYDYKLHSLVEEIVGKQFSKEPGFISFYTRFIANAAAINKLFQEIYGDDKNYNALFKRLLETVYHAFENREQKLKDRDLEKLREEHWFISNKLCGMSLYVDRFAGNITNLEERLSYFEDLGINVLHLMP